MSTAQKTNVFYVTCIRSHVCEARPNTDLFKQCLQRSQEHPECIGAMVIATDDCLGCWVERSKARNEYVHEYWPWEFCVTHDRHGSQCTPDCCNYAPFPAEIPDGQYAGQMKWLREDS